MISNARAHHSAAFHIRQHHSMAHTIPVPSHTTTQQNTQQYTKAKHTIPFHTRTQQNTHDTLPSRPCIQDPPQKCAVVTVAAINIPLVTLTVLVLLNPNFRVPLCPGNLKYSSMLYTGMQARLTSLQYTIFCAAMIDDTFVFIPERMNRVPSQY